MIEIGKKQVLRVIKKVEFGVYVGFKEEDKILVPKRYVPKDIQEGDNLEVFVYRDSEDRLIATTATPLISVGKLARLKVKAISKIGAFMDWGLEKDLFLPYKQQMCTVEVNDEYLVGLYVDKSDRLCATMKVEKYLTEAEGYLPDREVEGSIYEIKEGLGAFIAVDDKYFGLVPSYDIHERIKVGMKVKARVTKVREDGKLNLSLKQKAYIQMEDDSAKVLKVLNEYGGELPYGEKVSPEIIKKDFNLSKNAFKRALGRLLKEGKIKINENSINLLEK